MTPVDRRTELGENLRLMWVGLAGFLLLTGVFYSLRFLAGDNLQNHRIQHEYIQVAMIVTLNATATVMFVKSGPVNKGMRALLDARNRENEKVEAQIISLDEQKERQDSQEVILAETSLVNTETSLINTKRGQFLSKAGVVLDTRRMAMVHEQHDMDNHQHEMDARDVTADARDVTADARDVTADERDVTADERDVTAAEMNKE